jgi:ornithine--oxo-acid transaminase
MAEGVLSKDTHGTVVRFAPPLVIGREQVDLAVGAMGKVLKAIEKARTSRDEAAIA